MVLRPRPQEAPGTGSARDAAEPPTAARPCGGLARALSRAYKLGKPEILVLGPLCGDSVVYLAGRGARTHVECLDPPPPTPPRRPGEAPVEPDPIHLDLPDATFDLVLAWETLDFVPPERLTDVGSELRRVVKEGGHVLLFAHQRPGSEHEPQPRYRILADDLIAREPGDGPARRRWTHPNREIERALKGFTVQGIHLQRSQLREIVAFKPGVG